MAGRGSGRSAGRQASSDRMTPSTKQAAIDYRDRCSQSYVSTHFSMVRDISLPGIERGFPFFRQHLLPRLPTDRDTEILDVGCGYGSLLYALRRHGYRNVVGVDNGPEQVALARRLGIDGVVNGDGLIHLRDNPGRYDVIFALDLLEHFSRERVVDLVDGVAGALKPGGRFIVQTINAESPFGARALYRDFTHELAFTSTSITQLLRLGGFGSIAVLGVEPAVHGVPSAVRGLLWRAIRSMVTTYLAVETGRLRGHIVSQTLIAVGER